MDELISLIRQNVLDSGQGIEEDTPEFYAGCVVLLIAGAEHPTSWNDLEMGCKSSLGVDGDVIPQMVVALRLGGALTESGLADDIMEGLQGDDAGMILSLVINIALGRMKHFPGTGTYSLTPAGKLYVEQQLIA